MDEIDAQIKKLERDIQCLKEDRKAHIKRVEARVSTMWAGNEIEHAKALANV